LIIKILISFLEQAIPIQESLKQLCVYGLINKKIYEEMINTLQTTYQLKPCLDNLKIKSTYINYFTFYSYYYDSAKSLKYSLDIITRIEKIRKDFISTLIYPTILIFFTMIALFFMSNFIVPTLIMISPDALKDYDIILSILSKLPIVMIMIITFIISFMIISIIMIKLKPNIIFKYWFKIPIITRIMRLYTSLTLSLYLKEVIKKTSLSKEALILLQQQNTNIFVNCLLEQWIKQLQQGHHLFDVIKSNNMLNNDLKQTILMAHNSKQLNNILNDYFDTKIIIVTKTIKTTLAIILPIIISMVGILLILMYILIMMPIINLDYQI
ncbi:MAG: type II secretion system F family protein, partial [Bacilli bacterium]